LPRGGRAEKRVGLKRDFEKGSVKESGGGPNEKIRYHAKRVANSWREIVESQVVEQHQGTKKIFYLEKRSEGRKIEERGKFTAGAGFRMRPLMVEQKRSWARRRKDVAALIDGRRRSGAASACRLYWLRTQPQRMRGTCVANETWRAGVEIWKKEKASPLCEARSFPANWR